MRNSQGMISCLQVKHVGRWLERERLIHAGGSSGASGGGGGGGGGPAAGVPLRRGARPVATDCSGSSCAAILHCGANAVPTGTGGDLEEAAREGKGGMSGRGLCVGWESAPLTVRGG
jgi:hypothetical protein